MRFGSNINLLYIFNPLHVAIGLDLFVDATPTIEEENNQNFNFNFNSAIQDIEEYKQYCNLFLKFIIIFYIILNTIIYNNLIFQNL